jgi:hypothetical protein
MRAGNGRRDLNGGRLDAAGISPHFPRMKTITAEAAARRFEKIATMANGGERILVTHHGRPWVILQPPPRAKQAVVPGQWPDYPAHWRQHFPNGFVKGMTATELPAQDKEDRF